MSDYEFCEFNYSKSNYQKTIPEDNTDYYKELNSFLNREFTIDHCKEFYRFLELRYFNGQRLSYLGRILLTLPLLILTLFLWVLRVFTVKE